MMKKKKPVVVRQVWADNLECEFRQIKKAASRYAIVSMDTEFPGTIFQSNLDKGLLFHAPAFYKYFLMRYNVDLLSIIQLGLTLSDSRGNLPSFRTESCYVWQFNFRDFDIERDPHNIKSIELLEQHGTDFKKNKEKGIDSCEFAELVLSSGLVLSSLTWITFHGAYDFGFLIKILTKRKLPEDKESFMGLVNFYFGFRVYDMKYMMRSVNGLHGGLERVAKLMGIDRITGNSHEAGSDSLLTLQTFMRFKGNFLDVDLENLNGNFNGYEGKLFGLCDQLLLYIPEMMDPFSGYKAMENEVELVD